MSPEARQKLTEAGIPLLIRKSGTALVYQPCKEPKKPIQPKPFIHLDQGFIQTEIKRIMRRLPSGKDAYSFPEIAKALGKSENWVRTRFKGNPHLRNTGNASKKYFEVPRELLIDDLRRMYTSK
jgi:hypothetical protein